MARIRTIKPEFWKHEDLSELAPETHMLAAALLNYADDEGYFNANPKLIQAECCPLREDSTNVRRSIEALSKIGYIRLFEGSDGKSYGHIVTFLDHQRVDRAKPSKIKPLEVSPKDRRRIDDESTLEGKGREGNREQGKEDKSPPADAAEPCADRFSKSQHAENFEILWQMFDKTLGEKGSKKNAKAQFLKLKPDAHLFGVMVVALRDQIANKHNKTAAGQFASNFPHVERWLKHRRWEDEISPTVAAGNPPKPSKSDEADDAFWRYLSEHGDERDDGQSLAPAAVVEAGALQRGQH